jgi:hypothetical protein
MGKLMVIKRSGAGGFGELSIIQACPGAIDENVRCEMDVQQGYLSEEEKKMMLIGERDLCRVVYCCPAREVSIIALALKVCLIPLAYADYIWHKRRAFLLSKLVPKDQYPAINE